MSSYAYSKIIKKIIVLEYKNKVIASNQNVKKISNMFKAVGGSWEGIFKGSISDFLLLKKIIKFAVELELLEKK